MKDGQVRAAPSYVLLLGGRASCCGSTTVPHSPTPLPMGSNASFFWFGSTFCVPDKANKESWKRGEGPLKSRSHKAQSMLLLQVLRTKLWSYKNWCEQFFFVLAENDLAKPGRALHIEFMVLWLCCTHCEKRISAVVQRVFYWILRLDTLRTICYRQLIKPLKKSWGSSKQGLPTSFSPWNDNRKENSYVHIVSPNKNSILTEQSLVKKAENQNWWEFMNDFFVIFYL